MRTKWSNARVFSGTKIFAENDTLFMLPESNFPVTGNRCGEKKLKIFVNVFCSNWNVHTIRFVIKKKLSYLEARQTSQKRIVRKVRKNTPRFCVCNIHVCSCKCQTQSKTVWVKNLFDRFYYGSPVHHVGRHTTFAYIVRHCTQVFTCVITDLWCDVTIGPVDHGPWYSGSWITQCMDHRNEIIHARDTSCARWRGTRRLKNLFYQSIYCSHNFFFYRDFLSGHCITLTQSRVCCGCDFPFLT